MRDTQGSAVGGVALYSIRGQIEPTRISPAYRVGLLVVAAAMLLLPLLYVSLIALVGTGVWWHLTANAWIVGGRGGSQWRFLAYLGPALAGLVVMFFMVKPLLARPARPRDPLELNPEDEPVLFEFVRQICRQVGAPLPARVQVDCEVNASASLVRGVLSRDLALTIGLPLAAGLSVRELGGVLAHEFGHFAQSGGMRLNGIVRGINGWFARVVYERDKWDQSLAEWSREGDGRLVAVFALARGAVWLSRRVLFGLMWVGHAISCFLMRQMEYDADSYEVKVAGREAFERTFTRLRELGVAMHIRHHEMRDGLVTGRLPSDLPSYVAAGVAEMPVELLGKVREVPEGDTKLFDTHPSDADRLAAARSAPPDGILSGGDGPALHLFSDFERLCTEATRQHYEHDLGIDVGALTLQANDVLASARDSQRKDRQALHEIVGESLSYLRPIGLVDRDRARPSAELAAEAAAARAAIQAQNLEASGRCIGKSRRSSGGASISSASRPCSTPASRRSMPQVLASSTARGKKRRRPPPRRRSGSANSAQALICSRQRSALGYPWGWSSRPCRAWAPVRRPPTSPHR